MASPSSTATNRQTRSTGTQVKATRPSASDAASKAVSKEAVALAEAAMPVSFIERASGFLASYPKTVLGICGLMIIGEVFVINHVISNMADDPYELKYFNKAKITSRDLSSTDAAKIPTDSVATGVKNPIEDAFGPENPQLQKAETTKTDERVNEQLR